MRGAPGLSEMIVDERPLVLKGCHQMNFLSNKTGDG